MASSSGKLPSRSGDHIQTGISAFKMKMMAKSQAHSAGIDGPSMSQKMEVADQPAAQPDPVSAGAGAFRDETAFKRSEEFFGFAPTQLVDDVYNAAASYVKTALDEMENTLLTDRETKRHSRAIGLGVARIQDILVNSLERNIDKFELYVSRNIFEVPEHLDMNVVHGNLTLPDMSAYSHEDEIRMDEEIAMLRKKIQAAEFLNRAMKQKISTLQDHRQDLERAAVVFEQAAERTRAHGISDLSSTVAEIRTHESEIRSLETHYSMMLTDDSPAAAAAAAAAPEPADTAFLRCKAHLGGASSRDLHLLSRALAS